jgi:hypothetical protein
VRGVVAVLVAVVLGPSPMGLKLGFSGTRRDQCDLFATNYADQRDLFATNYADQRDLFATN